MNIVFKVDRMAEGRSRQPRHRPPPPANRVCPCNSRDRFSRYLAPVTGYNGLAQETTAGRKDMREQLEFGLELPAQPWTKSDPPHVRLHGPNQWPALASEEDGTCNQ